MRWLIILLGILILLLGLMPIVYNFGYLPIFLEMVPREGTMYNGLIAVIGGIITYLGIKKL